MCQKTQMCAVAVVAFIFSEAFGSPRIDAADRTAEDVLSQLDAAGGIAVILGDRQAQLAIELARKSELLLFVQLTDARDVEAARRTTDAAGLLNRRIYVEQATTAQIHLAGNLADILVVCDEAQRPAPEEEILRVLRPGGKGLVGAKVVTKPVPQGIDEWRFPYHGPDNNPQSADQVARAPYRTQFLAEPKFCPSPAVTVAAGGRVFRACGHQAHQANQNAMLNTLLAMNAYNGTILWKRPLREGFMVLRNTMIATPETLFLADDESCKLLDAATGRLRDEIVPSDPATDGTVWKWMALDQGVLYALIGGREFPATVLRTEGSGLGSWPRDNWPGYDYQDPRTAWGQGRTLLAVDIKTKTVLWRHREQDFVDGRAVCMKGNHIYFLSPEKFLACLRGDTGTIVWRTSDPNLLSAIGPLFPKEPRWTGLSPFPYARCNDKFLFFSGPRMPRIVAVSTDDGRLLWQKEVPLKDGGSVHLLLRDDALYAVGETADDAGFSLEYGTGNVLTRFLGRRGCTMATGTVDSLFYRAPEGTIRMDLASGRAEHIAPMRPPCAEGVIISGGVLHWGAWKCACPLSLYGHICLAPAGDDDFRSGVESSRLEFGGGDPMKVQKFPVHSDDWTTYQGNNFRTSVTKVAIPREVSQLWVSEPSLTALPTSPVAAGGLVFVGDDRGIVRALDASDGTPQWRAYTGAGIFFPPAVWEDRAYVGSADGHVYCFEAASGRLLWRFRAAPTQRRIPVYGRLLSTWPVAGGVVVEDGVVYAAAGIAHYDGTHVYALDALTGRLKWHNGTSGSLSSTTGSGVSLQGGLYLADGQLCFCGGSAYPLARYDLETGRCVTPPAERVISQARTAFGAYYPEYDQFMSLDYTLADGSILNYSIDQKRASLHSTLALFAPLPPGTARPAPDWRVQGRRGVATAKPAVRWEHRPGPKYNSFIVGPSTILAADRHDSEGRTTCFLAAFSIDDGAELWRQELPVAAVKAGTAIDHDARIFVSLQDGRIIAWRPAGKSAPKRKRSVNSRL